MSTEWALVRSRIRVAVGCSMSYKEGVKCGLSGREQFDKLLGPLPLAAWL